jgi:hypothetical protein
VKGIVQVADLCIIDTDSQNTKNVETHLRPKKLSVGMRPVALSAFEEQAASPAKGIRMYCNHRISVLFLPRPLLGLPAGQWAKQKDGNDHFSAIA